MRLNFTALSRSQIRIKTIYNKIYCGLKFLQTWVRAVFYNEFIQLFLPSCERGLISIDWVTLANNYHRGWVEKGETNPRVDNLFRPLFGFFSATTLFFISHWTTPSFPLKLKVTKSAPCCSTRLTYVEYHTGKLIPIFIYQHHGTQLCQ